MNKCVKFEIIPNLKDNKMKSLIYKLIHDMQYKTRIACNKAIRKLYIEAYRKNDNDDIRTDREIYYKSFRTHLEDEMKIDLVGFYSANISQTTTFITGKNVFDKKELLSGKESLSTFKNNMPIFLHNKSLIFHDKENLQNVKYETRDNIVDYSVDIKLFNMVKAEEIGYTTFNFKLHNIKDYQKAILYRLINGEYKQGSAQISYNSKNKLMLTCSYGFENKKEVLSDSKILGIDLGITKTATFSIFDTKKGCYEFIQGGNYIDGGELKDKRQKIEARKRGLQMATKWSSDAKTGHGQKKRMEDANEIGDKYDRFRDTYNHKVSKYIVDLAVKNNCGVIQMENLSGFSEHQSESFLKNWSYFDLQSKVTYKAEEKGIVVILVNPQYTSQRCSICGCIHPDNRDCKKNQAKFECVKCGHKMNADENASRNIALPNIEVIIQDEIKKSGLFDNNKRKDVVQ